ncbi:MAG: tetratricopeptide repeat protein, partial [Chitinophagaceae bacterium]
INKLLGCAVNEFSYEADSIGHGLFSWYLVQGLMGMADVPADNTVTFDELKSWTQKRVAAASRGKQNPVIEARDGNAVFATVTPDSRAAALALQSGKAYNGMMASRGMGTEDTLITAKLQTYIDQYNRFLLAAKLYEGDSSCLAVIYNLSKLDHSAAKEVLQGLQNHLAEALETRSQLVLNEYLKGKSEQPPANVYLRASADAQLADSLLPYGDPRKKNDQVMAHFHEAFSYIRYDNYEKFPLAEQLLRKALLLEDRAAYLYVTMSYLMSYQNKHDSAIYYAQKAEEIIPTWTVPKNILGNIYHDIAQNETALRYHRAVLKMDSSYAWSYNNLGTVMLDMGRIAEAEKYFLQSLDVKKSTGKERLNRDWAISYGNLGAIYKERGLNAIAEKYFYNRQPL